MLPKKWVGIWRVGGTPDDTLFGWIREHVVNDYGVFILDAGTLQVHAFDSRNSRRHWSAGGKGGGPGQLARPVDITFTAQREIAVLDPGNGRLSLYDSTGRFLRSITSPNATIARSVCFLSNGSALLAVGGTSAAFVEIDQNGREIRRFPFPWPVPRGANDFLLQTFAVRGTSHDECTFASVFGFGMVTIARSGVVTTHPYIEKVALPTFREVRTRDGGVSTFLDTGDNAGLGGTRIGDTIVIAFAGSRVRGRVLDLYLRDGRYLGSWPTPPEDRLFYLKGRMYGLSSDGATQRLRVWVDAADTARVLMEMGIRPRPRITSKAGPRAGTSARRSPPAPGRPPIRH